MFGGGFIGFRTNTQKRVNEMQARADGYWSYDAQNWVKISYEEGGGSSSVPYFSSQEWAETIVDTQTEYIGRWGLTLERLERTVSRLNSAMLDWSGLDLADLTFNLCECRCYSVIYFALLVRPL